MAKRPSGPTSGERYGLMRRARATAFVVGLAAVTACGHLQLKPNDVTVPNDITISGFWNPSSCTNASQRGAEHSGFNAAVQREIKALGYTGLTPIPVSANGPTWKYEVQAADPKHPEYGTSTVDIAATGTIVLPRPQPGNCDLDLTVYTAQGNGPLDIDNARNRNMPTAGEVAKFFTTAVTEGVPDGAVAYTVAITARSATQATVALTS